MELVWVCGLVAEGELAGCFLQPPVVFHEALRGLVDRFGLLSPLFGFGLLGVVHGKWGGRSIAELGRRREGFGERCELRIVHGFHGPFGE